MCGVIATYALLVSQNAPGHGELISSINALTAQIEIDKDNPALYFKRAELQRRHLDWTAAERDYDSAERHGFERTELLFYRGRMYLESGRHELALAQLDEYLLRRPDSADAFVIRARIPIRDPIDSALDLDRALQLVEKPTPEMFLDRAKLTASAGPEHFDRMLTGIHEGNETIGPLVSLISFGVDQCKRRKEHRKAVELIEKLPKKVQSQANWQAQLASLYWEMRDPNSARKHYEAALEKIDSLPASRRNTSATLRLEKQIRTELKRLE